MLSMNTHYAMANKNEIRQLVAKRIEELGTTNRNVSLSIGAAHTYIDHYINRGRPAYPTERYRYKLAQFLGIDETQLIPSDIKTSIQTQEGKPKQISLRENLPSNRLPPPLASVPEFGNAAATDGHIEGLGSQFPVDVIDIRLPENCFAVRVIGESMSPRYRPNEIVLIQPNRVPDAGQDCLVETHEGHGYIKTYLRKTSKTYILGQYSTKEPFEIPIARVKQLHAVRCRWG